MRKENTKRTPHGAQIINFKLRPIPADEQSPHGNAAESPTCEVVRLIEHRKPTVAMFSFPPDDKPTDHYQPVLLNDDSQKKIGILRGDLVTAYLSRKPKQGQYSLVETQDERFLGYYFKESDGTIRVEDVCTRACCPPDYFKPSEVLIAAPIKLLSLVRGDMILQVSFKSFRAQGGVR